MLELRDLRKRYLGRAVVDGISLTVHRGEVLGFLGPNGAGKSTTLGMLCGLVVPSGGEIRYGGRRVAEDLLAYKAKVGLVPEEAVFYPYLSGAEYLQLVGRLRGMSESALSKRVGPLLELLRLPSGWGPPIETYSKGMRQKLMVAAALLHDPAIFLLDEPESGLDVGAALVLRALVAALGREGKIVVYSSHVLEIVERVSERVVILCQGRVVADDDICRLRANERQPSLESTFRRLVPTDDAAAVAGDLVRAVRG